MILCRLFCGVDTSLSGRKAITRTSAVFFLELTVGVSWAVALDIGDEFAGSVSAVMNTTGSVGQFFAAAGTGYLVTAYNWNVAFGVLGALGLIGAVLFSRIDASKRVYDEPEPASA